MLDPYVFYLNNYFVSCKKMKDLLYSSKGYKYFKYELSYKL